MTTALQTKKWNTTLNYIVGKKIAEQALGFLTTAGERITAASTLAEAMRGALDEATPFLADWLSVRLTASETEYVSSSKGATASSEQYRELAKLLAGGTAPLTLSVASGEVSPEHPDGELLRHAAAAGVGSAVVLPLVTNGNTLGLLTAFRVTARTDSEFTDAACRLLTDLAGRLALVAAAFASRADGHESA
ncbi:MAG: GAF domain-containing protein [Kutzneria sp.]|nr:GAF domain-containing protein [Kutzneria sp.]MBV9845019.1 GAF domain-containing protein [Kutzneria sp.]